MPELQEILTQSQQVESLNVPIVLQTLSVSAVCGIVIFLVYRFFSRGAVYNSNFNLLNVMICVVTAFIIITIGSNLVLSLGMVGALSIVRFRAAVKDPLDVGFLFWGVAAGLTAGARLYQVALLGTAFIAALYILFSFLRFDKRIYLLILRYSTDADERVMSFLTPQKPKLKNKTLSKDCMELTAEIKVRRNDLSFLEPLKSIDGVICAEIVSYTGDLL